MKNRLAAFIEGQIGMKRDSVTLTGHNPRWKRLFSGEAYAIYDQLRLEDFRIYHIGSTSIPGIRAKPIIDILGSVSSLNLIDKKQSDLERLGYVFKGEYGIPGRRYCVLYDPERAVGYIHLHIFQHSHPEVERHLLFRDYLRTTQAAARRYEAAKIDLAEKSTNRSLYSERKTPAIEQILSEATHWRNSPRSAVAILSCADGGENTRRFVEDTLSIFDDHTIIDLNTDPVLPFVYGKRQSDSHLTIVEKIIESDVLYLATPVYWYAMAGYMKDFMDRFSDLMSGDLKSVGEALYGKKVHLLATGYDERLPHGFEVPFAGTAIYFGMDYMGAQYRCVR